MMHTLFPFMILKQNRKLRASMMYAFFSVHETQD